MDFQLMSIRTPRADSAKILKENAGETGSGPKFAGDEDKFFLEGIEEVLAQWEPEVGEMPPVDPSALNLPHHPKPIKALSRKKMSTDEVMEEAGPDSAKSTGTPSFRPAKDTVFLDGLEEVVPNLEEEGCETSMAPVPLPSVARSVDVLMPLEVPAVAVTVGDIRTPKQRSHEEYVKAEGPKFDAAQDAVFLDGVEEVVADWEGGPPGCDGLAYDADVSLDDGFFLDGLEEMQGEMVDGAGDMHHAVDPRALSMEEERPASIRTAAGGSGGANEPRWSADDDGQFLDGDLLVEEAVRDAVQDGGSDRGGSQWELDPTAVLLKRHLRVKAPQRGERASHAIAASSTATPVNTPTRCIDGKAEAASEGVSGWEVPVTADPYARPTTTPHNTPVDTECTNTPTDKPAGRSSSSLFCAVGERLSGAPITRRGERS